MARSDDQAAVFGYFRSYPDGLTRSDVVRLSGLSRTTVNQRLDPLLSARLLVPADDAPTGGRPADRFVLNNDHGLVLLADMGATGLRVAVTDPRGTLLTERSETSDVTSGPVPVLSRVRELFIEMLEECGKSAVDVRGVGVDVPGPVDHVTGRAVSPPIMTGWHNFDIPAFFATTFSAPVVVEKDVNAMALGEYTLTYPDSGNLVFVKMGTGIGTGIIVNGEIYRGSDGAAGDVGHIQIGDGSSGAPVCRCGNLGCVEAHAGGWALQRDLQALGIPTVSVGEVVQMARDGQPDATRLFRQAAAVIGAAVSDIVNTLNPRIVVLGGQLSAADDILFAGIREVVYRRSLPLATRRLQIVPSTLGERVGVHGLARLALDEMFSPTRLADWLRTTQLRDVVRPS